METMRRQTRWLLLLAVIVWTLAPMVAIVEVFQIDSRETSNLRAQVQTNTATNLRLAADEARLASALRELSIQQQQARDIGNKATISACAGRNVLRDTIVGFVDALVVRTNIAQTAVLQAPRSSPAQRAAALRLIASSTTTAAELHRDLRHETCTGPF